MINQLLSELNMLSEGDLDGHLQSRADVCSQAAIKHSTAIRSSIDHRSPHPLIGCSRLD
jgi:hypothetical protein